MAYFRGDHLVIDDGEFLSWWTRGSCDAHRDWGESFGAEGSAGVAIPVAIMDRFVLMRIAEMLVEGTATTTLDAMARELFSGPGNCGEYCLRQNQDMIRKALADLETRCLPPRSEGV
ncbi:MAG TPA: hypothetical protein VF384_16125 [Planctomycetota bacterium]